MWTNKNKYILSKAYIDDFSYLKVIENRSIDINAFCAAKHVLRIALHKNNYLNVKYFFDKYKNLIKVFQVLKSKFSQQYSTKNISNFINCVKTNNFIDIYKYASGTLLNIRKQFNDKYIHNREQRLSYFDSDYFRVISSTPFRRLQDKTQLFLLDEFDHSRRRLAHSIEVSSIVEQIVGNSKMEIFINSASINNKYLTFDLHDSISLCRTIGALHDIGNPPFGHAGENTINSFFKKKGDVLNRHGIGTKNPKYYNDLISFDGNAQSLRIASKLMPFNNKRGASLSAGVLGGIIKYPHCSDGKNKKIGYFLSEQSIIDDLCNLGVFIYNKRNPFACILEAADDIAYLFSDLEDSIHKQALTFEDFSAYFKNSKNPICLEFYNSLSRKFTKNTKNTKNRHETFEKTIKPLLCELRENIIASLNYNNIGSMPFTGLNVYKHIVVNGVCEDFHLLNFSSYYEIIKLLNKIKTELVFSSKLIIINEIQGGKILDFLLNEMFEAIIDASVNIRKKTIKNSVRIENSDYKNKILLLIPEKFLNNFFFEANGASKQMIEYLKMRLIIDFISGMTDNYAKRMYLELNAKK